MSTPSSDPDRPPGTGHGAGGGQLEVTASWRDRMQYGTVLPVMSVGGAILIAVGVPPPPSTPAAVAFYGFLALVTLTGIGFALTAWRSRLAITPSGIAVRGAVRHRLVPWNRLERIEVGRPYAYAGRHGRGPRWQALHIRAEGDRLPTVVAATNRPTRVMPELAAEVDAVLARYGHRLHREDG